MKKALSMLLPLLLVLGLAACDREQPAVTTALSTETTADPNGLSIPLTADFGGYEFHTLTAGNYAVEDFAAEEESEIVLDNAQYKRKRKVEQDYNVKILQDTEVSRSYGTGPGYMEVVKQVNAGDTTYDLCLIAGYDVSALAYTGNLYDMASAPGIDLTKPWWDQNAIRSLAVKDVVFFTTGEITVSAQQQEGHEIRNHEGAAAILGGQAGEAKEIAEADSAAGHGQHGSEIGGPEFLFVVAHGAEK